MPSRTAALLLKLLPKPLSQWRQQRPVAVRVRLRTWFDRCARKDSRINRSARISRRRASRKAESHSSSTRCRCSRALPSAVLRRAHRVQRRRPQRRQRRVGTHDMGSRPQSAPAKKKGSCEHLRRRVPMLHAFPRWHAPCIAAGSRLKQCATCTAALLLSLLSVDEALHFVPSSLPVREVHSPSCQSTQRTAAKLPCPSAGRPSAPMSCASSAKRL